MSRKSFNNCFSDKKIVKKPTMFKVNETIMDHSSDFYREMFFILKQ